MQSLEHCENTEKPKSADGILIKTTLVDFPSVLSAVFFLKGCNLRCPYCQNKELVDLTQPLENPTTIEELFSHLEKRKNVLSGLVVSGGEPLLNKNTKEILKKAKLLGFKTKLDTNGTLPERLQEVLENPELRADFVALDVKTSPEKYLEKLTNVKKLTAEATTSLSEKILQSIKIVSFLPEEQREFRTVLVPGIVSKEDIKRISELLPENATWYLAHFSNLHCLESGFENVEPFSEQEEKELLSIAKERIKNTFLR